MEGKIRVPSLVQLCIRTIRAKVHLLEDVGDTDLKFLKDILPSCNVKQLERIEDATERDLSPITNELWMKHYKDDFGPDNFNRVIGNKQFTWRQKYLVKKRAIRERVLTGYREEQSKKQSRQIMLCDKIPQAGKRCISRGVRPNDKFLKSKSNIMKNARTNHLRSAAALRSVNKVSNTKRQSASSETQGSNSTHPDSASSYAQGRRSLRR